MDRFRENKMRSTRMANDFYGCYLFVMTLLEVLGKTHMSVHDNNHAFIQANSNDVRFMGVHEGLQVFMHKDMPSSNMRISQVHDNLEDEDAFSSSTYLKFIPPRLDFKERFLGVPHLEKVTLVNMDENKTIHMSSVSGNTLHFHSSFFQDKAIPPKGNTTFAVVFLGRTEGQVSTNLYIHTSEGTFKYHVSGASVCSPYRLRPLGGVRLPLNAAFQPLIQLHNPHHYPIQVVEVYSSGSEFHLELPGGEMEGPKALWEVPPYTTKPVIRAKFQANAQSNHTAYIRLKLNNSEEVLVVPLEVEVTSQPGLYSQQHSIDFGIGGSQDEPKRMRLFLCSTLKKSLRIQSVSTVPETSSLKVNFETTKIPPGTSPVEVAELIFDWKVAFENKQTSGKILIKSKQNQYKLGIPFTAKVLEGGLKVDESATRFLTTENKLLPRNLVVENQFRVSVVVNNVSLLQDACKYFQIKNFKPIVIPPKNSVILLTLLPTNNNMKDLNLESGLVLFTNVSDVSVPLLIYNGKLTKIFPRGYGETGVLDVGLVGCSSTKTLRFGLQNNNPVMIEIKALHSNSPFVTPKILGIAIGNFSAEFSSQYAFGNLTNSTKLKPNNIGVLEFVIEASENEGTMMAEVTVSTQYENLMIPIKMSVAHGALETVPNQIVLDDCFPGKICTQPLKILSTFGRIMTATSVSSVPLDSRLSFAPAPGGSEIFPGTSSYIGDLKWEPGEHCENFCYLGVSQNYSEDSQWMKSEGIPFTTDMDATLLRDRYHRLLNFTGGFGSGYWHDLVLRLDTNSVREELFKAKVRLIWPKFSNTNKLVFPLTQVGNTTVQRLKLFNSASHMVVVQLVMEWAYPLSKKLFDAFPSSFRSNSGGNCLNSSPSEFYFSQKDLSCSRGTINATLSPGESKEVLIMYTPNSAQKSCSFLFIRNNLTVVEVIEIYGQASYAQLKFGNRKPGSENPLMFEIAEKHLKDCHRDKRDKKSPTPNLTVKRSFTVRNVGELSVYIHKFYINGLECEGFGYSVLNCGSFELPINGTRKIDVAFTPDFTLTKIQRTLTIDTSLGIEVNYTLVTTLPPLFLSACSSVLGRPTWEPLLYYSAVSFMVFLLFCVLAAAFFESDRILKCALMTLTRERSAAPLDFRQIGTSVSRELGQGSGRKTENHPDHGEKARSREATSSGSGNWPQGASTDEKHCGFPSKDDKSDGCGARSDESPVIGREKDVVITGGISGLVSFNPLPKNKKKLTKKNSNNADVVPEQDIISCKKKDKNFANSGWCSVFSRGNADKAKTKANPLENENVKHVRHDADAKKDENRKDEKKGNRVKKTANKEAVREEEETSSTTTDSSNDIEKESTEISTLTGLGATSPTTTVTVATTTSSPTTVTVRAKNERAKKGGNKERQSVVALECKENVYEAWDCEEDECEKEKKTSGKTSCKINSKCTKVGNSTETTGITTWKPANVELPKIASSDYQKHKINKAVVREKKEKSGTKRRFGDKASTCKPVESSVVHRSSPCWEHRSFSEVVARNESPSVYSGVVPIRNEHQKQALQSESLVYSDPEKVSDSSGSALGPIGSKKPSLSHWSPLSYGCAENQSNSNFFGSGFADASVAPYLQSHSSASDFADDKSHILEDSLPTDPENLWEDQHEAMQLMHQQSADYQMSWKENWLDYLWCSNRNVQQTDEHLQPSSSEGYGDRAGATWGSLLRTSWTSPTPWGPGAGHGSALRPDVASHRFSSGYDALSDGENPGIESLGSAPARTSGPGLFGSAGGPLLRTRSRENLAENGFHFDPFHSLSSIWAPKDQNTWNFPGN